jgi:adsorption protein B
MGENILFFTWLIFRALFVGLLFLFLISGLDDLFVDIVYYFRHLHRYLFKRKIIKDVTVEQLAEKPEQNAAILIPAWDESAVIFQMVLNTVTSVQYKNFHIFVGSYPNDEPTRLAVEKVREIHSNVSVIVTPADGPTNKADCLNWIFQGVRVFEKDHDVKFDFYVMHDAEDVVHPLSLKYYNFLIPRIHFIQIPVFPFTVKLGNIVTGIYMDEFAESHTKDMRVREVLANALPSAGVGTAISAEAIAYLAEKSKNQIFDIDTLTEDYMMGLKLSEFQGKSIFLQTQVVPANAPKTEDGQKISKEPMATREFFPGSFWQAVHQKARWILGISLQGWSFGWSKTFGENYFLFRDRKSVVTNLAVVVGYVVVIYSLIHGYIRHFTDIAVPPLIEANEWSFFILKIVLIMFIWRMLNRIRATWVIYGPAHGFMAVPRLFVGNILNFFATCAAIDRFVKAKISGKMPEWGKTDHAFPTEEQLRGYRHRLGDLLLEKHFVTAAQLEEAVKLQAGSNKRLGDILVETGALWEEDLVHALSLQNNRPDCEIDPFMTPKYLFKVVTEDISRKYNIFPLYIKDNVLILATDNFEIEEGEKNEIEELLKMPTSLVWCATVDIEFARKRTYIDGLSAPPPASRLGTKLLEDGGVSEDQLRDALRKQKRSGKRLGDILVEMGAITESRVNDIFEALKHNKESFEKGASDA